MYVLNGHSVSVGGILLAAVTDPKTKTFVIVHSGTPHNGSVAAVRVAWKILSARMRRFLGPEWREVKE